MSNESDLQRYRNEANSIRTDIGKASSTVATQRKKASDAMAAAGRSNSPSTVRTKSAEAERATKAANDAEAKRAGLEKKLADVEIKIARTQQKYEKERDAKQAAALDSLRRRDQRAASQFRPAVQLGAAWGGPAAHPRGPMTELAGAAPAAPDVFLSHASEDKDEIARPLREALESRGVTVWFDELKIKVGQSIRQEIEAGIAACRFGIVILSPHFFSKQWTQAELDALFGKKMESGENLVLPIWHHISKDEVNRQSPMLAGILALNTAVMTVDEIADELAKAVRREH